MTDESAFPAPEGDAEHKFIITQSKAKCNTFFEKFFILPFGNAKSGQSALILKQAPINKCHTAEAISGAFPIAKETLVGRGLAPAEIRRGGYQPPDFIVRYFRKLCGRILSYLTMIMSKDKS